MTAPRRTRLPGMAAPLHDEPGPGRQTGRSRGDELDLPALYLRGMSPRLLTREEELQLATTLVQGRRELALVVCSTPPGVERLQRTARQLQRRELRLADVFDGADTVPAARLLAVTARLVRLQRRHAAVDLGPGRARTALQRRRHEGRRERVRREMTATLVDGRIGPSLVARIARELLELARRIGLATTRSSRREIERRAGIGRLELEALGQ